MFQHIVQPFEERPVVDTEPALGMAYAAGEGGKGGERHVRVIELHKAQRTLKKSKAPTTSRI